MKSRSSITCGMLVAAALVVYGVRDAEQSVVAQDASVPAANIEVGGGCDLVHRSAAQTAVACTGQTDAFSSADVEPFASSDIDADCAQLDNWDADPPSSSDAMWGVEPRQVRFSPEFDVWSREGWLWVHLTDAPNCKHCKLEEAMFGDPRVVAAADELAGCVWLCWCDESLQERMREYSPKPSFPTDVFVAPDRKTMHVCEGAPANVEELVERITTHGAPKPAPAAKPAATQLPSAPQVRSWPFRRSCSRCGDG